MITARSTWCNFASNVSRQSMPRDITGTIVDCINSTSISLAMTSCRGHVSTTALLLTALETNFRDELLFKSVDHEVSESRASFSESQSMHFFHQHDAKPRVPSFSIKSAKCNAIRHARITSPCPCPSMTMRWFTVVRFLAIRIFSKNYCYLRITRCIYACPMNFQKRNL